MSLDLILKDISDPILRENFFRIQRYIATQSIVTPDWKFFEVTLPQGDLVPITHGMRYVPKDIIVTSVLGDQTFYWLYAKFDRTNLYISTAGKCTLRFFAGTFPFVSSPAVNMMRDVPFSAPGYTVDGGDLDAT